MKQEPEEKKRKRSDGETGRQGDTLDPQKSNPSRGQQAPPKNPPPRPDDIDDIGEDEEEETEQRRRA